MGKSPPKRSAKGTSGYARSISGVSRQSQIGGSSGGSSLSGNAEKLAALKQADQQRQQKKIYVPERYITRLPTQTLQSAQKGTTKLLTSKGKSISQQSVQNALSQKKIQNSLNTAMSMGGKLGKQVNSYEQQNMKNELKTKNVSLNLIGGLVTPKLQKTIVTKTPLISGGQNNLYTSKKQKAYQQIFTPKQKNTLPPPKNNNALAKRTADSILGITRIQSDFDFIPKLYSGKNPYKKEKKNKTEQGTSGVLNAIGKPKVTYKNKYEKYEPASRAYRNLQQLEESISQKQKNLEIQNLNNPTSLTSAKITGLSASNFFVGTAKTGIATLPSSSMKIKREEITKLYGTGKNFLVGDQSAFRETSKEATLGGFIAFGIPLGLSEVSSLRNPNVPRAKPQTSRVTITELESSTANTPRGSLTTSTGDFITNVGDRIQKGLIRIESNIKQLEGDLTRKQGRAFSEVKSPVTGKSIASYTKIEGDIYPKGDIYIERGKETTLTQSKKTLRGSLSDYRTISRPIVDQTSAIIKKLGSNMKSLEVDTLAKVNKQFRDFESAIFRKTYSQNKIKTPKQINLDIKAGTKNIEFFSFDSSIKKILENLNKQVGKSSIESVELQQKADLAIKPLTKGEFFKPTGSTQKFKVDLQYASNPDFQTLSKTFSRRLEGTQAKNFIKEITPSIESDLKIGAKEANTDITNQNIGTSANQQQKTIGITTKVETTQSTGDIATQVKDVLRSERAKEARTIRSEKVAEAKANIQKTSDIAKTISVSSLSSITNLEPITKTVVSLPNINTPKVSNLFKLGGQQITGYAIATKIKEKGNQESISINPKIDFNSIFGKQRNLSYKNIFGLINSKDITKISQQVANDAKFLKRTDLTPDQLPREDQILLNEQTIAQDIIPKRDSITREIITKRDSGGDGGGQPTIIIPSGIPLIPPPPDYSGGGFFDGNKRGSGYSKSRPAYSQDFTSAALGLEPLQLTPEEYNILLQSQLSGLELRRAIIIKS